MASDTENEGPSRSQSPNESEDQENGDTAENQDMEENPGDLEKDGQQKKPASNSKDPSRPRRKKARRACYACQRAHLTCGDERPCQRCIKRGLQDACADGVRKKAKYLHDAPPEALMPGGASHFQYINSLRRHQQQQQQPQSPTYPITPVSDLYNQRQSTSGYPSYGPSSATQVSFSDSLMNPPTIGNQQSPITAQFPSNAGQPPSMQSLVQAIPQTAPQDLNGVPSYETDLFDTHDLNQYDFDPTAFNFGNHYGALEFGMLGQISSGAAETPPGENGSQMTQNGNNAFTTPATISTNYSGSPVSTQSYMFGQDQIIGDWRPPTQPQSNVRQRIGSDGLGINRGDLSNGIVKQEVPNAFSIGVNSAFATPTSGLSPQQSKATFDTTPTQKPLVSSASAPNSRPGTQGGQMQAPVKPQTQSQANAHAHQHPTQQALASGSLTSSRRRGDPSAIYENVTQPYSYTSGFHSLIAFLTRRFSSQDTVRIAKALASIRPSFISCTKTLGREDLIFMEKCFQRTLWEYEDFISACGTPTLVCRRTGEIVAAGKEFSILTGWRRDVLLGNEPNLNVNTGGASGQPSTGTSSRGGLSTPRVPEGAIDSSRPQPVFLAEVLDDQSVIEFYEDFARLAFGDSKGVVTTRCRLLKYRTKEDEATAISDGTSQVKRKRNRLPGKGDIAGEAGIDELGDKDGKVECTCCWTVKRDLFDLPMMIVMNFLPCI